MKGMQAMQSQINDVCKRYNNTYSAKFVSWNDNSRQQNSAGGSNITDARLKGRNGEDFLVIRPDNFNEKIGRVRAQDVAVIVGNHIPGSGPLSPQTLDTVLNQFPEYSSYACRFSGQCGSLYSPSRDMQVGIRFQSVFLPVPQTAFNNGKVEFYPDTYNYQTTSDDDPKNIILLCTSQGTFVQQDGRGSRPQYLHSQDGTGSWNNHFLEAMMTRHEVSLTQNETEAERLQALAEGKAVSTVIGIRSMGLGFNRLMTVQIPLKQQKVPSRSSGFGSWGAPQAANMCLDFAECEMMNKSGATPPGFAFGAAAAPLAQPRSRAAMPTKKVAQARSARVSYGSVAGPMPPLAVTSAQRDEGCSITITVQFYFVIDQGYAIAEKDIRAAVDICEEAYRGCEWSGNLMSYTPQVDFAKQQMTASDASSIFTKLMTQPPAPIMAGTSVFPTSTVQPPQPMQPLFPTPMPMPSVFSVTPTYNPLFGVPQYLSQNLTVSMSSYSFCHDQGLKALANPTTLDQSYHWFRLAGDIHLQLTGTIAPSVPYNQACCLSMAIRAQVQNYVNTHMSAVSNVNQLVDAIANSGGLVGQNLPPTEGPTVAALVNNRLNAAVQLLDVAVSAGYNNGAHMSTDTDLATLRELRSQDMVRIIARAAAK